MATITLTKNSLIAVIDTGVEGVKVNRRYSVLGDDGVDFNGHGTSVIQTILRDNPYANIISIKALEDDGSGSAKNIVNAIYLAIDKKAEIINLSAIGKISEQNNIVSDTIRYAISLGITVVVAAGNYNDDVKNYVGANVEEAIVVANCDKDGNLLYRSNYGDNVDIAVNAPNTSYAAAIATAWLSLNDISELKDNFYLPKKVDNPVGTPMTIGEDLYAQSVLIFYSRYPDGAISTGGVADQWSYPDYTAYTFQYPGGQSTCNNGGSSSTITTSFNGNGGTAGKSSINSTVTTTKTWSFSYWSCYVCWNDSGLSEGWESYSVGSRIALGPTGSCEAYGVWNDPTTSTSGSSITLPSASRTGHTFAGWYTAASGGSKIGNASATWKPTSSSTLYAHWTANTYKITYNANGGSGAPSAQTYTYASSGSFALSSTKPTRTGYTFLGWSQSSTATSASYSAGQQWAYSNASNYTLYAVWKINTYTVSYNANGGSGAPSAQTKTYGTALTLSSTKPTKSNTTATGYTVTFNGNGGTPSKTSQAATNTTSYTFKNWNTNSGGTGTSYSSGGSYTANAAATLYAQWNSSTTKGAITTATASRSNGTATRTVTFDASTNGGSCSTSSLNSTATVTYSCSGWYTAASGGTIRASSGGSYTPSASETVYAQWTSSTGTFSSVKLPSASKSNSSSSRTVTISANGGNSTVTSKTSTATVTYSCSGWYTAASGGTKRAAAGGSYTPSASEKLYAQFTSSTGTYSSVTLPTAEQCTRSGFKLLGFSTSSTATTASYAPGASFTPSSSSQTLYAVWEASGIVRIGNTVNSIYVYRNGKWVQGIPYVYIDGEWKQGG